MKGLANKRHHQQRMKARARKVMAICWTDEFITDRAVGIQAGVHCRACSCWMCQRETRRPEPKFTGA